MAEKMLAHFVAFALKDNSPEGVARQLDLCQKYLANSPGTVYYGAGTRTPDLLRDVNDKQFDVAVSVIFKDRAAHDAYQVSPKHVKFIEESRPLWSAVRVFDADVS